MGFYDYLRENWISFISDDFEPGDSMTQRRVIRSICTEVNCHEPQDFEIDKKEKGIRGYSKRILNGVKMS